MPHARGPMNHLHTQSTLNELVLVASTNPARAQPSVPPRVIRHEAAKLAAGYSTTRHVVNAVGLAVFVCVAAWVGWHVFSRPLGVVSLAGGLLAGWVLADFAAGAIHWAGDTWGRPSWPVIGGAVVRSFREHHVDPLAITRHGYVQLLGEQAIAAAPLLAVLHGLDPADGDDWGTALLIGAYTLVVATTATNIFHRWAHMRKPPLVACWLQRMGILISFRHHAQHHGAPHLRCYCIAIGWLNPLLDNTRFWRALEWLVWKVTGALPREDDLGHDAAVGILRRNQSVHATPVARDHAGL